MASRLQQSVLANILDIIVRKPESLPTEGELGERLDVSRTVVREAVKTLQAKGVLEIVPGIGTRIRPVISWDVMDPTIWHTAIKLEGSEPMLRALLELRLIMEPKLAGLAALRRTDKEATTLVEMVQAMDRCVAARDLALYNGYDHQFHEVIAKAGGNLLLLQIERQLSVIIHEAKVLSASPEGIVRSAVGHRAIAEAIANKDEDGAAVAMQDHLEEAQNNLFDALWKGETQTS